MTTSGRWSWHCFTPSRCMSTALFPLRRQPYWSTSDGGTAHSSYQKIGRSSISLCWPTNRRRKNMDSRSKTTCSPILMPCLSCFAWNLAGSDLRKSVTISAPSDKASDTLTTVGATCPLRCCTEHRSRSPRDENIYRVPSWCVDGHQYQPCISWYLLLCVASR